MKNKLQTQSIRLGLILGGLAWGVGCDAGDSPGLGSAGSKSPAKDRTDSAAASQSEGDTNSNTGDDPNTARGTSDPKPAVDRSTPSPTPASEECCRLGKICKPGLPLCATTCPGGKWGCPGGKLCSQSTSGKFDSCVDACDGLACGSVCCAPGAACNDQGKCELGDLAIQAEDVAPAQLTTLQVSENSCAIQEGCVNGSGARTVANLTVTIENVGSAAVAIGAPWDTPAFHQSSCASEYLLPNFIQAEVLGSEGEVVASGHLPTSCVVDPASNSYRCSLQGLNPGDKSEQPQNFCNTLDLTGLLAGTYAVRLTVNPDHTLAEKHFDNNSVTVNLEYPECPGTFCGGVCCPSGVACLDGVCMAPDLRPHQGAVEDSVTISHQTFGTNSCEIAEACVGGPGRRRLLQFEGRIENLGPGDLDAGDERNNPLFEYSECHDHHHFVDFTDYRLLGSDGQVAAQGHKQSFCLISMDEVEDYVAPSPGLHPEPGETGCNFLKAGWADIYGVGTDCQWVDITDVAPGDYVLQVAVNPTGAVGETNISNNVVRIPVSIPEDVPCQEEEVCGDIADQDCDDLADKQDPDCRAHYESECCNAEDTCSWGHDRQSCDCGGVYSWDSYACYYAGGGGTAGSGNGGAGGGGPVDPECCSPNDPCRWADDYACDCNGAFAWDRYDCIGYDTSIDMHP